MNSAGILRTVRWAIVCAVLFAAGNGEARREPRTPTPPVDDAGDFWREAVEPNGDRVKALLQKANAAISQLDTAYVSDSDWAVDQRMKFYRDAYNLMRHARKLAPDHVEVLSILGRAADELGKTREAIDALEACVRVTGPDKASAQITGRLGAIYLRLGERDTAIRWLRYASSNHLSADNAPALVHLANAFAARGEIGTAIDTLKPHVPATFSSYSYSGNASEATMVAFSLVVIYDRDEQRGAAFELLAQMQTQLQAQYAHQVLSELSKFRFAPAEDQHYVQALLYESLGQYVEARAEWALYAASGDSPWRGRALDHIAAIDKQRRIDPTARPTQIPTPTRPVRHRRRTP